MRHFRRFDFAAIGIENTIAEIGQRVRRGVDQQNLIATDAKLPVCQRTCALRGHLDGHANTVQHDKVVAGAMHFCEIPDHGCIIANL